MGSTVLVDAQFGITKILRPYAGFEVDYQGKNPTTNPIALTERGVPLDPLAGTPGYAPNLLRGLAVPLGARIVLWLPNVFANIEGDVAHVSSIPYRYAFAWRLRSTFDYRQIRGPYHYPKQGKGVPDMTAPPGKQDRVIKPAGWQTVTYTEPEPPGANNGAIPCLASRAAGNMHAEDLVNLCGALVAPGVPGGGAGAAQQGILDPGNPLFIPFATSPLYNIHEIQALGDELMIFVYRDILDARGNTHAIWDFVASAPDQQFSEYYGNGTGAVFPDIGVYVMAGAST